MDELIKRLRDFAVELRKAEDALLVRDAADVIEELSRDLDSMNEANIALYGALPKWIPVTERFPGRGENVLVANKRGKQWDVDKAWLSCLGSGFDRCGKRPLYHVTHWMPLPEPPKEG